MDDRAAFRRRIAQAVLAYGQWRLDLYRAVMYGNAPLPPAVARRDDQCAFGVWLDEGVAAADRVRPECERVRMLHAAFHASAADVMELAVAGRTDDAAAAMGPESAYGRASSKLTLGLMAWLAALQPAE